MRLQGVFVLHPLAAHKALEGLTAWLLGKMKGEAWCSREVVGFISYPVCWNGPSNK